MKKIILLFTLALCFNAFSQESDTVSLVVSGQGITIEEARINALRNAIEQAFGAFISSKTEILNDSLIKDELISVSNGNIRSYNIVSEVELKNGYYQSTLNAMVSISALVSFCTNRGISSEFNGGLFARNLKLQRLNEDNEMKAANHLSFAVKQMSSNIWSYDLKVADPILDSYTPGQWIINCETIVTPTKNLSIMNEYFYKSLMELRMQKEEIEKYKRLNIPIYKLVLIKPTINHIGDGIRNHLNIINKDMNALYEEQGEIIFLRNVKTLAILLDLVEYLNYSIGNFTITDNIDTINMVETIEGNQNTIQNKTRFECKYNWYFNSENYWGFFDYYKGWNYGWTKEAISYHYKIKSDKLVRDEKEIKRLNNIKEKGRDDTYYIERYNEEIQKTKGELFYFYDSTRCYCAPKSGDGSLGDRFRTVRYSLYVGGMENKALWINLNLYTTPIASIIFYKSVNEVHLEKIQEFQVLPMNLIETIK